MVGKNLLLRWITSQSCGPSNPDPQETSTTFIGICTALQALYNVALLWSEKYSCLLPQKSSSMRIGYGYPSCWVELLSHIKSPSSCRCDPEVRTCTLITVTKDSGDPRTEMLVTDSGGSIWLGLQDKINSRTDRSWVSPWIDLVLQRFKSRVDYFVIVNYVSSKTVHIIVHLIAHVGLHKLHHLHHWGIIIAIFTWYLYASDLLFVSNTPVIWSLLFGVQVILILNNSSRPMCPRNNSEEMLCNI